MEIQEKAPNRCEKICALAFGEAVYFPIEEERSVSALVRSKQPGRNTPANRFPKRKFKVTKELILKDGVHTAVTMVTRIK